MTGLEAIVRSHGRSVASVGSLDSVASAGCIRSVASTGSIMSIGSSGCILSIGSAGSLLSLGSAGSIMSINSAGSILSRDAEGRILHIGDRRMTTGEVVAHSGAVTLVTSTVAVAVTLVTRRFLRSTSD